MFEIIDAAQPFILVAATKISSMSAKKAIHAA
jgi:hypothetical protein